jgi:hypothetical protein
MVPIEACAQHMRPGVSDGEVWQSPPGGQEENPEGRRQHNSIVVRRDATPRDDDYLGDKSGSKETGVDHSCEMGRR